MTKFPDTETELRLRIGFGTVLFLMLTLLVLGIVNMAAVQERLNDIVNDNEVKVGYARDMRDAVRDQSVAVRNVALFTDRSAIEAEQKRIEEQRRKYHNTEIRLRALVRSETGKATLARIDEAQKLTDPLLDKAVELGLAGKDAEVARVLLKEVRPVQRKWLEALDELVEFQKVKTRNNVEAASRAYSSAKVIMILVGLLAIAIDAFIALWITRSIIERKRADEELRRKQEQLLQGQKMEALGKLACGIAHDFNNLLTAIQLQVEMLMAKVDTAGPFYGRLKQIQHAVTRGADLSSQLLLFSRKESPKIEPVRLDQTVTNLSKMLGRMLGENILIKSEFRQDTWTIRADPGSIERVIMNLMINARDAMPQGGRVILKTENVNLPAADCKNIPNARPGKWVCLSVRDTGAGMNKEDLSRVFEPFYSTKETGKGTGLGLSIVQNIVEKHEGWINVYSNPDEGTTFQVYLPALPEEMQDEAEELKLESSPHGRSERILLVEDDEGLREFATTALSAHGYTVFPATDAREALDIFEEEKGRIDLFFSDVILPGKNGIQLAEELLLRKFDVRVLLSSGYTDEKSQYETIKRKGFGFIQKPYSLAELLRTTRQIIDGRDNREDRRSCNLQRRAPFAATSV